MPCSLIQRRRARATSARFCSSAYRVFFKGDAVSFVETPHRSAATGNPCLGHRCNDLLQRQIRLFGKQTQQKLGVILQRRHTSTARSRHNTSCRFPALHPDHDDARADPVEFRRLASRCPRSDQFNHSFAQVHRIRLRHCSPQSESMLSDSRIGNSLGIPPDSRRTKNALKRRVRPLSRKRRRGRACCYGSFDTRYAAMAIMSASSSLSTTPFISGVQTPVRAPVLMSLSWR